MASKTRLDRDTVVEAAARLVNQEGAEALSLHSLARLLGVQTPSLYNHVEGLPGLQRDLAALNARLLAERLANAAIGRSGREAVAALAHAIRAHIKDNPGLYLTSLRASGNEESPNPALTQAEERTVHIVMAVLASFNLKGEDAVHAARALRSAIHGFVTLEIAGGFGIPLDLDESFRRLVEMLLRGLEHSPE